jgi:integrase
MPSITTPKTPSYRRHKPSNQAVVTIAGRDHYLGPWQSAASKREYDRIIAEWLAAGRRPVAQRTDLTLTELTLAYYRFAEHYYTGRHGCVSKELKNIKVAMRPLKRLYGVTRAADFGPVALKAVRQIMVDAGLSRGYTNHSIGRIRRMFKWAVGNELVPPSVYQGLAAVDGLRRGRSEARETEPVRPVDDAAVDTVKPFVSRQVWAMIELQRLTGMRPGEVVLMRGRDLDTTGHLWEYRPPEHKGEHLGRERVIPLGPRVQAVITPFLKPDLAAYLFDPRDAERERHERMAQERITPAKPSQVKRHRQALRRMQRGKRGRAPRDHYSVDSYRRAIAYACEQAFPPPAPPSPQEGETMEARDARLTAERKLAKAWRDAHRWHPHQLRHSAATRIRKDLGLEAAQVMLGHARADVTEVYAERNQSLARTIAAKFG